jgi:hypothetical protein
VRDQRNNLPEKICSALLSVRTTRRQPANWKDFGGRIHGFSESCRGFSPHKSPSGKKRKLSCRPGHLPIVLFACAAAYGSQRQDPRDNDLTLALICVFRAINEKIGSDANRRVHGEKTHGFETENQMTSVPTRVKRLALFGPPLLLEGEDPAIYNELLARMCAAVQPVDVIGEMFVADVVSLEWEILRLRRLKSSVLKERGHKELEVFLSRKLDYGLYAKSVESKLARFLQESLEDEQAQELAHRCFILEPDAVKKVNELLTAARLSMRTIQTQAKNEKAKELAQERARRESTAIELVDELLALSGLTMHEIMASALTANIDQIERIDRLISIAETRRNASLREIDRRRSVLANALRRNMQQVEEGEFEVIETTRAEGKARRDQ